MNESSIHTQPGLFASSDQPETGLFEKAMVQAGQPISPLSMCVLGSGSGGNATVVRFGETTVLVDAGFGPRSTAKRLRMTGVAVEDLKAVFLTHLDSDHFRPTWVNKLIAMRTPVYLHRRHLAGMRRVEGGSDLEQADLIRVFGDDAFDLCQGIGISTVELPHDQKGSTGYRFDTLKGSLGYATDLGDVLEGFIKKFTNVDVLAIECNYDRQMQIRSGRPLMLKQRIMNGYGHLANEQSFAAVKEIIECSDEGKVKHVVLLHRSRQCNTADHVRKVFGRDKGIAKRVVLAEQGSRTDWVVVR